MSGRYVVSIDQGTASSRCLVFDGRARIVSMAQKEHRHHYPMPGWVEHDPEEIWRNVVSVVGEALEKADLSPQDLSALGIANQRETTVLWDRSTGKPVHNAINWEDTRTDRLCRTLVEDFGHEPFREKTGLPVSTYFSGPKVRWLLDHIPGCASAPRLERCCSARWTRGCCGTCAVATSPTSPTPAARC